MDSIIIPSERLTFRRYYTIYECIKCSYSYNGIQNREVLEGPSLIAGLDCGLDRWTGLLDWITGSNQTASQSDDACVAHGTASKAEV